MVFAPAVLDKVFAALNAKIAAGSPVVKALFARGLAVGDANWARGVVGSSLLYNAIAFKKVQALLGGRVKFMGTGSAPLSPKVQTFVQTCFNAPVRQGYGLTETCATSCIQLGCDNSTSVVGPPVGSTLIKLVDWPEGNYLNADEHDPKIGMRRGEVLVGGPSVCQGYLVDPAKPDPDVVKKNEDDFSVDADGVRWFHTGDIGQITRQGCLQIIDRKKDLVKLQQGEYVALSKVESALKACPLVEIPMCYARSTESYCVALVCPSHAALKALAKSLGVGSSDVAALCADKSVVAEVTKQCQSACKGKLVGFETPKKIGLVADPWTPENDLLTAAMKLKRVPICKAHAKDLDALYK
jgi:long-subunit acyl-CoA synthetase (AMP-forming)